MENKELYTKKLDESGNVRKEINDVHRRSLKDLQIQFSKVTGLDHRLFIIAKDMLYYSGGYPNENSRAKLDVMVERFAAICKILRFLGEESILNEYLKQYGIDVKITVGFENKEVDFEGKKQKMSDVSNSLMEKALSLQEIICKLSDSIKIVAADEVEKKCGIKRPHFVGAVNLKYKQLKGRNLDDDLSKINVDIVSNTESISVF